MATTRAESESTMTTMFFAITRLFIRVIGVSVGGEWGYMVIYSDIMSVLV